jgi:hypothetical protein
MRAKNSRRKTMSNVLSEIKKAYPNFKPPKCELVGIDGNAYSVMGHVTNALKRAGYPKAVEIYREEAMSGDYDNLLCVSMEVADECCGDDEDED